MQLKKHFLVLLSQPISHQVLHLPFYTLQTGWQRSAQAFKIFHSWRGISNWINVCDYIVLCRCHRPLCPEDETINTLLWWFQWFGSGFRCYRTLCCSSEEGSQCSQAQTQNSCLPLRHNLVYTQAAGFLLHNFTQTLSTFKEWPALRNWFHLVT